MSVWQFLKRHKKLLERVGWDRYHEITGIPDVFREPTTEDYQARRERNAKSNPGH